MLLIQINALTFVIFSKQMEDPPRVVRRAAGAKPSSLHIHNFVPPIHIHMAMVGVNQL